MLIMLRIFAFLLLINLWLSFSQEMKGQSLVSQSGARSLSTAGSSVTFSDVWSQLNNQAGLAYLKGINIGVAFQNKYLVKELSTKSIALAMPLKSGVFGLNYCNFGYSAYNENKFGLAFARNLGKRFAVGIQLDYIYTHIDGDYGSSGIANGEIGILVEPIENLFIAAHLNNVWRTKRVDYSDEYLPTVLKIGASYKMYEKALLSVEVEKDMDFDPVFKTGLELELIENLFFRSGVATNPNEFSFGTGYAFRSFQVDLSFTRHPVLGFSQGISIVYSFKDRL
jgi:hypothetical protein